MRRLAEPWARTLAVLLFAQVLSELAFSFALPFIPLYIQELGVADVTEAALWAGAMSGVFALVMAVLGPVWGALADRFGRRLMIQRAMFGACLVIGSMGLIGSVEQLFALRVLQGAVTGVVAAISTVVSLTVPRQHLASALGSMQAAVSVGTAIGPIVGGSFADAFGYRAAFLATGALFLLCGALVTIFVAEPPREAPASGAGAAGGEPERLLRREVLAVVGLMVVVKLAHTAPIPILPLFVQQLAPASGGIATTVGVVVAAAGLSSTASALLVGRISERYGRRATLLVCLALATLLSPLHGLVGSVAQLIALRIALGLVLGGMVPAIQALTTDLTPPGRRGAAFGLLATANALGNGGGPVAGSLVAAWLGIPAVFAATAPVFVGAGWLLARLPLPGGKR
jgi:DHA1 family multidrug resistance protein-like MFS transporter